MVRRPICPHTFVERFFCRLVLRHRLEFDIVEDKADLIMVHDELHYEILTLLICLSFLNGREREAMKKE